MFVLNKTVCLFLLAIILIILIYVNWYQIQPFLQKSTIEGNTPAQYAKIDPSDEDTHYNEYGTTDYDTNKVITSNMNQNIQSTYLDSLQADITTIQNTINSINAKLPYKLEDITVGSVTQDPDYSKIGVEIKATSTDNFDSIQGENIATAAWTLDFILPKGEDGVEGPMGDQGLEGPQGEPGTTGYEGRQGDWGNCSSA